MNNSNEFDQVFLHNLVSDILKETKNQGATSAEVEVGVNKGFTVDVHQGDVETIEYHQDKSIGITVYFGKKTGVATLSDIRPNAIQAAVAAACNIAKFTDEDPYTGIADKKELAFDYPQIDLGEAWGISVEEAITLGKECEAKALSVDKRIIKSESVSVNTATALNAYGNTNGFIGVFPSSRHEISCILIGKEKEDMQRDYYYTVSCDPKLLATPASVAELAVQRTLRRLSPQRLTTRKAPVLFAAEEARSLLGHFVTAISGSHIYRKTSYLVDQLGKQVFPDHINLQENPHLPKGLGSVPFDDDGVKTRSNKFVEKGILQQYSLGIYSARKLGMETTGNAGGVHNLFITTGDKGFDAMLKALGTGLLVTELMGNGINLVTGDYSRGASGFWVENGEIQFPVQEITIAGHLQYMYRNIVEVGNDIDKRGNILTGSILLEEMMIAGD